MDKPEVTILMATYNGECYIRQQLNSLVAQTYPNWHLLIRDDGSTDRTVEIIDEYISRYRQLSRIIKTGGEKGAVANFSALFTAVSHDRQVNYVMFCDQDDIWKADKIERTMAAMQLIEGQYPAEPALVYGNFELMDNDGNYVPGEFRLKHQVKLNSLLSFNYVYGCTSMLNRAMIIEVGDIPLSCINHDYWLALVASLYQSRFINVRLLRYRQHDQNASGNVAGNNSLLARVERNLLSPGREIDNMAKRLNMFREFQHRYGQKMSKADHKMLERYLNAFASGRIEVIYAMARYRLFRNGLWQTIAPFLQVLLFYPRIIEKIKR